MLTHKLDNNAMSTVTWDQVNIEESETLGVKIQCNQHIFHMSKEASKCLG